MRLYIFDFEVVAHDWLCVFRDKKTKEFTVIHNDNYAMQRFMSQNPLIAGFNNKHYDQYIMKAVLSGFSPEDVKEVNDYIIRGGNGWECPMLQDCRVRFAQYDLMDDMQVGTSLKSIEAHLGRNICESSIPFDVKHKLTDDELAEMIAYCKEDVIATDILDDLRHDYLANKVNIGRECGLTTAQALYLTNAKLTAKYLGASKRTFNDERDYQYPDTLDLKYIPADVIEFFDRMHSNISDEDLFSSKHSFKIGECEVTLGFGGIHGAIPNYEETATDTRTIRNKDVASYYPHQMTINGFTSRCMADPSVYANTIERRVAAKKSGDKNTANALKLVLNTTYGAMLDKFNDLYDPRMGRSVCISGQLQLLELTMHLVAECPTIKIIQLNTDGIMVSFDKCDEPKWDAITQEWQDRTGFELEEDFIKKIVQKDVNNYVEVGESGNKLKGGMLVRGIGTAGAFKINNNANIVAVAVACNLADGTPVEKIINECETLQGFQIIARASSKYKAAYHEIDGVMKPTQKCNRVYASNNPHYGTLYKVGRDSDTYEKIAGLPASCVIDNDNHCTMDDIDKEWYIRLAYKQIDMFKGTEPLIRDTRKINSIKKDILNMLGE